MIFFFGETPDGWGIPGIHGMLAEDELDGYVQGAVYLIRGDGENLLIDSGNWSLPEFNNGMGEFLIKLLDKEKNKLKYIFLTHFHYDHVGNADALKKRYGAEILCHPLDRPIIEDPLIVTRRENVTRFGLSPEELLADFNLEAGESLGLSDPEIIRRYWDFPVQVDRTVEDGDLLEVGGLELQTVHLPGHAPGQIGLWNPKTSTLYSADLLHYPTPLGPYPIGDAKAHSRSIQRSLELAPEFLLEGHGLSAYSKASSRRRLVHMQIQQQDTRNRILFVLRRFDRPSTILELLPEVLPIKTDLDYPVSTGIGEARAYAKACIQCHLVWLVEDGLVQRVKEDGKIAFLAKR
ncbi:MAG: MBL fold metallo-hydrolase [Verrucomicrobia bacterium]|nr:MBL fold metallo-hydrolase [Verrucomicrobiota bacterium]MBV9273267.1 MBL fold metallo-hydrolase [Verrucomicrobiota bacterium]